MSAMFNLLGAAALSAVAVTDLTSQRLSESPDLVFGRAESEIAIKGDVLKRMLGKELHDWSVDLDEGWIRFTTPTKVISAPVQVIGTYNTLDGTFLWGWDHPSVPAARGAHARLARQFGEKKSSRSSRPARSNAPKRGVGVHRRGPPFSQGARRLSRAIWEHDGLHDLRHDRDIAEELTV